MSDLTLGELRRLVREMHELPDETVILTPIGPPDGPSHRHRVFGMFIESNIDTFRRQLALLPDVAPAPTPTT